MQFVAQRYELVGPNQSDHCLRRECLLDLQLSCYWPGAHYRFAQPPVALLRAQNFCAHAAPVVGGFDFKGAERSLPSRYFIGRRDLNLFRLSASTRTTNFFAETIRA